MIKKIEQLPCSFQKDIEHAIKILKENGAEEVYLFGSIVNGGFNESSDIDIAVKGIKKRDFYKVASILMFEINTDFDLVDLDDKNNRFSQMLLKKGTLVRVG